MTSAVSVEASTVSVLETRPGASPRAALQKLWLATVPFGFAREVLVREHYTHTMSGGTILAFGVFDAQRLRGVATLGVGPFNAASLVRGVERRDCLTLTRLWLADELPRNSESHVLGTLLRAPLTRATSVIFLISYADPSRGHLGTIYQASNWLYTGLSQAADFYDIGDGIARHSRSIGFAYGTRSVSYLRREGVPVKLVAQSPKHRYVYFLDRAWRDRLRVPELPYPKRG